MTRYIITGTDSGGGCLKQSCIAERVLPLGYELVHGPAPLTSRPLEFFAARTALWPSDADKAEVELTDGVVADKLTYELRLALGYDSIELWIDPNPNAQLQAAQVLDWLAKEPDTTRKLHVCFLAQPLGEQTPEAIKRQEPELVRVDDSMLSAATACWDAFRQPTPQSWFDLLTMDLRAIRRLPRTVELMLDELPDAKTGLIGTQRDILGLVSQGFNTPGRLMAHPNWQDEASVFGYWERGRLLCDLALCAEPALTGMNGERFILDLHQSTRRRRAFFDGPIALTSFGEALLAGTADFAIHNSINRWWGGTRLTNDNLWRWNAATRQLLPPRDA